MEAVRSARRLRVPLVGTNHWAIGAFDAYVPIPAPLFANAGIKAVTWYYNHCDIVTGPSRSVLDEMRNFGLRRPHVVISNPIDTALYRPRPPAERQHLKAARSFSEATILYAGRLAVEKNIDILIRALHLLRREFPHAMLALAGHGSARPELEALAHALGVASQVRFLGTLSAASLAEACQAADIFATASTSETQCMALLPAMSTGLPAVGARSRALVEYAEDAGLLAEPGDAGDVAAKLGMLLRNPSLRHDMGSRAQRFAERFSLADVASRWEELYTSLAESGSMSLPHAA